MKKLFALLFVMFLTGDFIQAQLFGRLPEFNRQDTLRGTITAERAWWDVTYYHLDMKVNLDDSTFSGTNTILYKVDSLTTNLMQIDLQEPMQISEITQEGKALSFEREGNVFFVETLQNQKIGEVYELKVQFFGKPKKAVRAPWDGGISWTRDKNGNPFVASSNQGIGASIWWPNKDHAYDEPDSMLMSITVRDDLMNVSNGRLRKEVDNYDGTKTWHWFVSNPINNYGVNINIGDYVHFEQIYEGEKGELDMDFYVLSYNLEKAIEQFADAPRTMEAFEYWFGPYPFYEDSYKLVEAPYLGMEHQSSVTYGNGFENGYLGRDLSNTGWGLKFDFIIIHETGHEWFANNITYKDVADMWIHESFTHYSEYLFLEYHFGKKAANEYARGVRLSIQNDRPIIGIYNVNYEGSSDMYYKGGNMLHTIRQVIGNDELWREILRGLNKEFYHQTVTTEEIENYIIEKSGKDLEPIFDQYLRDYRVPVLEYYFRDNNLVYRWNNTVSNFNMPIKVYIDGKEVMLKPRTRWQTTPSSGRELRVDIDYYVASFKVQN
ncbi:MAG TPA: peptidase M1 [Balneola sp.]|nr:peptidase M1 [Balneola sp.]MAO78720.1 peptidase M1 [Balneola sp.]MBF64765.1 peptidase M1 [Balneola sp.]HAH50273.1 peptidase M1 [Balneola sp.]|tara:strand:- start:16162 stop:17808 length:1647 start_codon:yes stop_codon:yes gene_type:complete